MATYPMLARHTQVGGTSQTWAVVSLEVILELGSGGRCEDVVAGLQAM